MQFIEMRNEFRRQIGALYGVMPLFQADVSTSGGLNNEGLQITVTNEAIEDGQAVFNDDYYPWVCDQLGITDYHIELNPHEEQDEIHDEEVSNEVWVIVPSKVLYNPSNEYEVSTLGRIRKKKTNHRRI